MGCRIHEFGMNNRNIFEDLERFKGLNESGWKGLYQNKKDNNAKKS